MLINLYILSKYVKVKKKCAITAYLIIKAYLINKLKANLLLKNNVLKLHRIVANINKYYI